MKKSVLSIFFILVNFLTFSLDTVVERVFIVKVIAFHKKYEVYCTLSSVGYYKYPQEINGKTVYLTYEGEEFFTQCKFDENFTILDGIYPCNMWTNSKGEMLLMKKRYGPVIDKNKERKNYPYGFGKN